MTQMIADLHLIRSGALSCALLLFLAGCGSRNQYSQTMLLMGTTATITVTPDTIAGRDAVAEVFRLLQERDKQLSYYGQESELSKLNAGAASGPVPVSKLLFNIIRRSLHYSRQTGGAFDVTATSLKQADGYKTIRLDLVQHTVHITNPEARVDLGGITVGYVLDEVVALLRSRGQKNFMIDIGGDIFVSGYNPQGKPWCCGIRDPLKQDAMIEYLALSDKSVTTSGNYLRPHIIDPQTHLPATGSVLSVTVIAPTGLDADALATAFFIMGIEKTRAFISARPDIEAVFVKQGEGKADVIRVE